MRDYFTRMHAQTRWLLLPLLLLLLSTAGYSQELINNGSFNGVTAPAYNTVAPGWTNPSPAFSPDVNDANHQPIPTNGVTTITWVGTPVASPDGGNFTSILIRGTAFEANSQTITGLNVGQQYTFSYYFAITPNTNSSGSQGFTVIGLSGLTTSQSKDVTASSSWQWIHHSITVTATATSATITLEGRPTGPNSYASFDGVSLVPVAPACNAPSNIVITGGGVAYCQNASATALSATFTGDAATGYQWYANGSAISGANASTYTPPTNVVGSVNYTVQVTNSCGNLTSGQTTVNVNATPATPSITAVNPTCSVTTGGINVTSPVSGATYTLSPGGATSTTGTFTGLAAGSGPYTVTSSISGCVSSASNGATVGAAVAGPPTPVLSTPTQPTCSVSTGSFTISNYNPAYTYTASPSTGVSLSAGTFTAPAGTYTITATSGACVSSASAPITINAQPTAPVTPTLAAGTQPTCSVATGTFTIGNYNAAYTYTVSPSTGVSQSGATITAPAGTYTVTAASGTCSSSPSATQTLTAATGCCVAPAQPTLAAGTQPTCSVSTGTFTISNYNAAYTYTVSPSTGVSRSGATVTAPAGTYTVTATSGTCASSASASVTLNAPPTAPATPTLAAGTQPTCSVTTGTFTISNYNAAYTYTVSPATGVSQSGATVTAPAGTYTVIATSGACASSASASVTLNAATGCCTIPSAVVISGPTSYCVFGTSPVLTASFTGSAASYQWYYNSSAVNGANASTYTVPTSTNGTVTISVTITNACGNASGSVVVTGTPAPTTPTFTTVQPTCSVATGTFTIANYNAAYTYTISPTTGVTQSGATVTAPAGTYTVTAASSACGSSATGNVTINPQPASPATPTLSGTTATNVCPATTANLSTLVTSTTPAGSTLEFHTSATPTAGNLVSTPGAVAAGTYYAFYLGSGGCYSPASAAVTVTIATCPTCTAPSAVVVSGSTSYCVFGTSPVLTASFTGSAASYQWYYNGNAINGANASTYTVPTSTNGTVTISVTITNACGNASGSLVLTGAPAPTTPTFTTVQPTCSVATGTFTIANYNAAYTYTISPSTGVTQSGATVTAPAGTYTVTAASSACGSSATGNVTINPQPTVCIADLTPILTVLPSTTYGTTNITIVNDVFNVSSNPSSGLVTVYISKDTRISATFSSATTFLNGKLVQNSAWTFDGTTNGGYYILTTSQVIPAGSKLSFGLNATLTPGGTTGMATLTATIVGGSGGETNAGNNTDSEKVNYFAN